MSEKITELKKLLADICEKTRIEVRLTPNGGQECCVSMEYAGQKVDVWMDGTQGEGAKTAAMLQYLLDNADTQQLIPDKDEALKNVLLGEGGGWYAYRFMTKYAIAEHPCLALCIQADKFLSEVIAHIETCLTDTKDMVVKMDENSCAVVRFSEEGQPVTEFAQFLSQSIYEEMGIKASIGVGREGKSFSDISVSYHQAVTALRMSAVFHSKGEVHSYKEYLLVKVLEEVPEARLKDYLQQLQINGTELFEDEDMITTAEAFLENSLNVSETSRNLYMHRNTLMYRLDKIERATGLNIRNFSDAVTFRIISILYKLLQR